MAFEKWRCTICGWIYDPESGVLVEGIEPCTPFEEFPDDFKCPKCGAVKKYFEKVSGDSPESCVGN